MAPYFTEKFGNASSMHFFGKEAKKALEDSRNTVASLIGAGPDEIFFTSGGTEANNIALLGLARASQKKTLFLSKIEHEAVMEPCAFLKECGYRVYTIPVDRDGIVDLDFLRDRIDDDTFLVSVMSANNETGSLQPLEDIRIISDRVGAVLHTDAVQAVGKMKVDTEALGIGMLSASSHKFYGPKGAGFLYIKRGLHPLPIIFGGGHEKNVRSGTENVPGAVGMAEALSIVSRSLESNNERYKSWKKMIIDELSSIQGFHINQNPGKSLPNIINMSFIGINGESLAEMLSLNGIAVSTASACTSHKKDGKGYSRVLDAMGMDAECAGSAIRVSTGIDNDDDQISYFIDTVKKVTGQLRRYSSGI